MARTCHGTVPAAHVTCEQPIAQAAKRRAHEEQGRWSRLQAPRVVNSGPGHGSFGRGRTELRQPDGLRVVTPGPIRCRLELLPKQGGQVDDISLCSRASNDREPRRPTLGRRRRTCYDDADLCSDCCRRRRSRSRACAVGERHRQGPRRHRPASRQVPATAIERRTIEIAYELSQVARLLFEEQKSLVKVAYPVQTAGK